MIEDGEIAIGDAEQRVPGCAYVESTAITGSADPQKVWMNWSRAIAVWVLIVVTESIHGTIRQLYIAPVIGDLPARQVGVVTGSVLILVIAWLTARWLNASTLKDQLRIGALWVVLIVVFEFGLGAALGYTRERLLSDYNPTQGGLMGFGLLFLLFAPALGAKLGQKRSSRQHHIQRKSNDSSFGA